jgi:hypothetical protein
MKKKKHFQKMTLEDATGIEAEGAIEALETWGPGWGYCIGGIILMYIGCIMPITAP